MDFHAIAVLSTDIRSTIFLCRYARLTSVEVIALPDPGRQQRATVSFFSCKSAEQAKKGDGKACRPVISFGKEAVDAELESRGPAGAGSLWAKLALLHCLPARFGM